MSMHHHHHRGDIVFARVQFPHQWCPALVLRSDNLGVFVSFFDDIISPSYFVESEVVPFEEAFPSLMSRHNNSYYKCDTFRASLHSALRLLGQRVISGLRCRCQMGQTQRKRIENGFGGSGYCFDPNGVLGFVLNAAVSPWVETPRFVDAVRVVAQLHAFRSYCSIQQRRVYRETQKTGNNVKLRPCSSMVQEMHPVTLDSVALEPKEEYQIISKLGEKNMATVAIKGMKSTDSVPEGDSEHLFKNKLLIVPEIPTNNGKNELVIHSPALDPFYMVGESLKSERHSLLRFKNISDPGMVDIWFGNCSTMSENHFYVPSNFKTHLRNFINKRKDNALEFCCRLSDIETTIYLTRKRRRLDEPASCDVFPQICRVQETEGNAYISKYTTTRPRISHIKMLEPEESSQKDNQAGTFFCETNMNFTDEVQKMDLKRSQNLTLQESFTCESLSNLVLGFHSYNCEIDASAAKVKGVLRSNSSIYQKRLQISCNGDTTALKSKKSESVKLSPVDCLVEGKDCYQRVASSCSIFNSKVGQQSKTHVPLSSTSLYMKFPKNFNLPSKGQLIKKFSVFGSIDSSKTRVFWYTGSAKVAFFQDVDTVAAYLYVKKKVWFGEANVRFWLDPFEHKRRGFKRFALKSPSASKPIGPPLKSCLKKSNPSGQENSKKRYKVRFTIET